jgi:hypothetical protein
MVVAILGCTTVQFAALPETDDSRSAASQCLASLGLWEDGRLLQMFSASDPSLIAVWSAHPRGSTRAGTTVWIKRSDGELRLRFLPGAGEDSAGTAVLARSFAACVPQHLVDIEVVLTSQTSPDFR